MTVMDGASVQLATGHPQLAPRLATMVNGAILELALEEAGTYMSPVPPFSGGTPKVCPWTLKNPLCMLEKVTLGRLQSSYTTPEVLTGELLLIVTTALGLNLLCTTLVFPLMALMEGLGLMQLTTWKAIWPEWVCSRLTIPLITLSRLTIPLYMTMVPLTLHTLCRHPTVPGLKQAPVGTPNYRTPPPS